MDFQHTTEKINIKKIIFSFKENAGHPLIVCSCC